MKFFLTGATGYIGGSLARKLIEKGYQVHGLVRSKEKAKLLQKEGVQPVHGSLDDADILAESAREAEGVINAAPEGYLDGIQAGPRYSKR